MRDSFYFTVCSTEFVEEGFTFLILSLQTKKEAAFRGSLFFIPFIYITKALFAIQS